MVCSPWYTIDNCRFLYFKLFLFQKILKESVYFLKNKVLKLILSNYSNSESYIKVKEIDQIKDSKNTAVMDGNCISNLIKLINEY